MMKETENVNCRNQGWPWLEVSSECSAKECHGILISPFMWLLQSSFLKECQESNKLLLGNALL